LDIKEMVQKELLICISPGARGSGTQVLSSQFRAIGPTQASLFLPDTAFLEFLDFFYTGFSAG
jgi:hypothetical protein